jgi:hypothetical protein
MESPASILAGVTDPQAKGTLPDKSTHPSVFADEFCQYGRFVSPAAMWIALVPGFVSLAAMWIVLVPGAFCVGTALTLIVMRICLLLAVGTDACAVLLVNEAFAVELQHAVPTIHLPSQQRLPSLVAPGVPAGQS